MLTRASPDEAIREALAAVEGPIVVGGHTHQQLVRKVGGAPTYVNAGSVGMPYEGKPGAFWLVLDDARPSFRHTSYDVEAAATELRASGFPDVESQLTESLLNPIDPDWVAAFFEHAAGRRPDPGAAPAASRAD